MASLSERHKYQSPFHQLPVDVLPMILARLTDQHDWTLDARIISKTLRYHPSVTLLARPELARYVHNVTESGAIQQDMEVRNPGITQRTLSAISLCKNLNSMTWIDDTHSSPRILLAFLEVVRRLPVRELTIRTLKDLGEDVWVKIMSLDGLTKVALCCIKGPPRVLQGLPSLALGNTLTHLELDVCALLYPSSELLAKFPRLQHLRLKGTPTTAIPRILAYLPDLQTLDTEYFLPGSGAYYSHCTPRLTDDDTAVSNKPEPSSSPQLPALKHLKVRSSSMDPLGAPKLWVWIQDTLMPRSGLETLHIHAFTYSSAYSPTSSKGGNTYTYAGADERRTSSTSLSPRPFDTWSTSVPVPKRFMLNLGVRHGATLREFILGGAQLMLADIHCVCAFFKRLEVLECAVESPDVDSIVRAIAAAKELTTLKLHVHWTQMNIEKTSDINDDLQDHIIAIGQSVHESSVFTVKDVYRMMRHSEDTKLRKISIDRVEYKGKWVLLKEANIRRVANQNKGEQDLIKHRTAEPGSNLQFAICVKKADDRWNT